MAESIQFPDCCGVIVINKFKGGHPGANPDDCISEEALDEYLTKQEQQYYGKRSGLMSILSTAQEKQIGPVFVKRKWELLKEIRNPRTGAKLFVYFRDLNPTAAREKRIFGR